MYIVQCTMYIVHYTSKRTIVIIQCEHSIYIRFHLKYRTKYIIEYQINIIIVIYCLEVYRSIT